MEKSMKSSKVETRQLVRELRKLKVVKAPSSFLPAVLMRTGLADASLRLETPIGPMFIAYNKCGISAILRAEDFPEFQRSFRRRFGRPVYPVENPPPDLIRDVSFHLSGERRSKLRLDLRSLSDFERSVLLKALTIPRAEVRPYAWIAREIGNPGAVRAVGSVLAKNPLPLLIPCHRVTRSDGHVGAYGFGNEAKRAMLSAEGIDPDELERLADSGVRYYGSKRTRVFCFPTCHSAKRISERHRIPFRSKTEATQAGYRPCKICRPVALSL